MVVAAAGLVAGCTGSALVDAGAPRPDAGSAPDAGAASDAGPPPDAYVEITGCPGERPATVEDCVVGDDFADCDGHGSPVFACLPDGYGCQWFMRGCVPTSHLASSCPATDLCCHDGSPFYRGTFDLWAEVLVHAGIKARGRTPPDLDDAPIEVLVVPGIAITEPRMVCTEDEGGSVCPPLGARYEVRIGQATDASDDTLSVWAQASSSWYQLHLEVLPDDPTRARACLRDNGDVGWTRCPPDPAPQRCADAGRWGLSEHPAARSGTTAISTVFEGHFEGLGIVRLETPPDRTDW